MKRLILLLLPLCLLLAACGSTAPAPTAAPEAPAIPAALLDAIRDSVQPGTAGSSLKAASVVADLLDWAAAGAPAGLSEAVSAWLKAQSGEARAALPEQLDALRGALEQLAQADESAKGLMQDAGLENRGPWSEEAFQRAEALLSLLQPGS